jgi:hypothetical protein
VDADLVRLRRHVLFRDPAPRTVDGEHGHTDAWSRGLKTVESHTSG